MTVVPELGLLHHENLAGQQDSPVTCEFGIARKSIPKLSVNSRDTAQSTITTHCAACNEIF